MSYFSLSDFGGSKMKILSIQRFKRIKTDKVKLFDSNFQSIKVQLSKTKHLTFFFKANPKREMLLFCTSCTWAFIKRTVLPVFLNVSLSLTSQENPVHHWWLQRALAGCLHVFSSSFNQESPGRGDFSEGDFDWVGGGNCQWKSSVEHWEDCDHDLHTATQCQLHGGQGRPAGSKG